MYTLCSSLLSLRELEVNEKKVVKRLKLLKKLPVVKGLKNFLVKAMFTLIVFGILLFESRPAEFSSSSPRRVQGAKGFMSTKIIA